LGRFPLLHEANEPLRIRRRTIAGVEEKALFDHSSLKESGRSKHWKVAGPNMVQGRTQNFSLASRLPFFIHHNDIPNPKIYRGLTSSNLSNFFENSWQILLIAI
jgi:hypothetical protein